GTATDIAGNVGTVTRDGINIDQVKPSASVDLSPPPNAAGFRTPPVVAHFTCADGLSGVGVCPSDQSVSADGINQTVTATVTDRAGNATLVTSGQFSIDQVGPTIVVSLSPSANANGWNNGPVTAHFACTDAGSGVASCPADRIVSTDGTGLTVSGTATD